LRFFVEETLPQTLMFGLKLPAWEFMAKAVDALQATLGPNYIVTALPLLWKVCWESHLDSTPASKFMTAQLLKVLSNAPLPYL
jgi:hypothetical protein